VFIYNNEKQSIMANLEDTESSATDSEQTEEEVIEQIYALAANLLFENDRSPKEVKDELIKNGIDAESSSIIVDNLTSAKRKIAGKDMFYGALWCIGGTIATVADFGYIFWGAILFGGFQFLRGAYNYLKY
jgi:hypothetical protein